jgi:phosphoribosylformylglycinamidine cyclo-ligase
MAPTRIYVKAVLRLLANQSVHAISHITGGGFYENLPRVVPDSMAIRLNANAWTMPPVFHWLKATGNIDTHEMYRTFNCGIGLVLVVPAREQEDILSQLKASGEQPVVMGQVEQRSSDAVIIDGV